MSGWTPGSDYVNWHSPDDPSGGSVEARDTESRYLLAASPQAFADLEGELISIIALCHAVAPALRAAENADWYGNAKEAFTKAVGHFPRVLDTIAAQLQITLGALQDYADVTFTQQQRLVAAMDSVGPLNEKYQAAVTRTWPSRDAGTDVIKSLQRQISAHYQQMVNTLDRCYDARQELHDTLTRVAGAAPHPSLFAEVGQYIENAAIAVVDSVGDTGHAISAFLKHQDLKTLERLGKDLGTDAGLLAVLASAGAAAPELGAFDAAADSKLVLGLDQAGEYFGGVAYRAGALTSADELAEGKLQVGLIGALQAAVGYDSPDDAEAAVNRIRALNNYMAALKKGTVADLGADDRAVLGQLFPAGVSATAATQLTRELEQKLSAATTQQGMEQLEDFLKDTFVVDPLKDKLPGAAA